MTHLDLFSGIGGFALAWHWATEGHGQTVGFCENEKYCQQILSRHWPGVPIHSDIGKLDGRDYAGVALVTGGFPCQPFSCAGQRRGQKDDRYLWPEMLRVIAEAKPAYVLAENVPGLIGLGLDDCLSDLEAIGYATGTLLVPASAVGAYHRRNRIWIVAHAQADAGCELLQGREAWAEEGPVERTAQPGMGGAVHGLPGRMDMPSWSELMSLPMLTKDKTNRRPRLQALGNAIVPQVAAEILRPVALALR